MHTQTALNAAALLKAMADELRLRILLLILREDELCVCELTGSLQQSQPKISRHLALLRASGLLTDRRQGQWVYYRLNTALPDWVQTSLQALAASNPEWIRQDRQALQAMGGRPQRNLQCC